MRAAKYTRKAGGQVPAHVRKMMRRLHPNVEILWHNQAQRWCLVQSVKGKQWLINVLDKRGTFQPPTMANTVYYLNSTHPSRFNSKYAREKFLADLDRSEQAERVKRNSRGMIRDGSVDIWNKLNNRLVVARP